MPLTIRLKKWVRALAVAVALLLVGAGVWFFYPASLPRMHLADGGEFRVLKVVYGKDEDHHLHGAPRVLFRLWEVLPRWMQNVVPYPPVGTTGESFDNPSLGIWFGWFDPVTGLPEIGPAGDVMMTLDSGEQRNLGWPNPGDDYRQILITDPPRDSQWVRFSVPINHLEQPAEFTIRNPAWRR